MTLLVLHYKLQLKACYYKVPHDKSDVLMVWIKLFLLDDYFETFCLLKIE